MEALNLYFRLMYVPSPHSLVRGVRKLEPGCVLTLSNGVVSIDRYWKPSEHALSRNAPTSHEYLRNQIGSAVKRQLISDRPVGISLSGGFDSTILLHHAAEESGSIKTFTSGFECVESEYDKFNRDLDLARKIAKQYGTDHSEFIVKPSDARENIEDIIWHMDEPVSNPSEIPQYLLNHFASQSVSVLLDGSGGDELFGGYRRYRISEYSRLYRLLVPRIVRSRLSGYDERLRKMNISDRKAQYELFFSQKESSIKRVLQSQNNVRSPFLKYLNSHWVNDLVHSDDTEWLMHMNLWTWLTDESLVKTDRMSMAHSVEGRVPLLDLELLDYTLCIPRQEKVTVFSQKKILKSAYKGHLPGMLYNIPKRGWFSPGAKWIRDKSFLPFIKQVLSPTYHAGTATLLNWDEVQNMLGDHVEGRRYAMTELWALLTLQIWAQKNGMQIN